MPLMTPIVLRFSESVLLANATSELQRHQQSLRAWMASGQSSQVVADLSALKDIDTSALAVLLQLDRDVRRATGQALVIRSAPDNLLSLAKLSSLLPVLRWEDAAIH